MHLVNFLPVYFKNFYHENRYKAIKILPGLI